jgi:hypothetical protein
VFVLDKEAATRVSNANSVADGRRSPHADWTHLRRGAHAVQFYSDQDALLDLLGGYVGSALAKGGSAIVIATPVHRTGLARLLRRRCFDLQEAARQGRYAALDAADTLAQISPSGVPDAAAAADVLGAVLHEMASGGGRRDVSVFGEMVALLWSQGRRAHALTLEEIWNSLGEAHDFSVCCAYPIEGFRAHADAVDFLKICSRHSHLFPADRRTAL